MMKKSALFLLLITYSLTFYSQTKDVVFYKNGLAKYDAKNYKGALKDFNSAIFYNSKVSEYYFKTVLTYLSLDKPLQAYFQIEKAIKKDSTVSKYYFYRGYLKYKTDVAEKNYPKYIADYDKAIELDSNNYKPYKYKALSCYHSQQYKKAITSFTYTLSKDSLDPEIYYYRGLSRIKFGDKTGCIDLKKAKEMKYKNAEKSISRFCNTSNKSLMKNGELVLQDTNFYTNPEILFHTIDSIQEFKTFYNRNNFRIQRLGKTISVLPINRCLNKFIGVVFLIDSTGKLTAPQIIKGQSNQYLDSLVINKVNSFNEIWTPYIVNGTPINYKGFILFGVNTIHSSSYTSRYTEKYTPDIYHQYQNSYYIRTYITDFDSKKNCIDNDYYYKLGLKEFINKKYKRAISNFKNALKSTPNDIESQYNLAMCYLRLDNTKEAIHHFKKCAKLGNEEALKKLSQLE